MVFRELAKTFSILLPSEAPVGITVGVPNVVINIFNYPASAHSADALTFEMQVKNTGDMDVRAFIKLRDERLPPEQGIFYASEDLAVGQIGALRTKAYTMPNEDLPLRLDVGYFATTIPPETITDTQSVTIQLEIPTAITIRIPSPKVAPGETVNVSGQLTRTDNGTGLAEMNIEIWVDATLVSQTLTGTLGNYSTNISAPTTSGSYTITAKYTGAGGHAGSLAYMGVVVSGAELMETRKLFEGATLISAFLGGLAVYNDRPNEALLLAFTALGSGAISLFAVGESFLGLPSLRKK